MNRGALVQWWQRLAERERRLVVAGSLIVLVVATYLLLWEPAAGGIRKLEADLPQLRAQEASLGGMAAEAASLRTAGGPATAVAPSERVAAVRRSLQRAGLWRDGQAGDAAPKAPLVNPSATVSTLTVAGAVTTVAAAAATRLEPPEIVAEAKDRVRVRFENIDYGVWIAWLASTETELATRAARVSVAALAPRGAVGHVKAEALLDWTPAAAAASTSRP